MEGFNLDLDRERRLGFPEVIYGEGKSVELLSAILSRYETDGKNALVTRLQVGKAERLAERFPDAFHDPLSGSFMLRLNELDAKAAQVAIVSAGSSDQFVVNEAVYTLNLLEEPVAEVCDVGVAGIHRLLNRLESLRAYQALIVVAGFEGALPSVVGGLLPQPIVAVPTSTGYGVGKGGVTALHAMLSSCANGITVVNVDNGYGAAMAIYRMLRQWGTES